MFVDEVRAKTMRKRLAEASELVEDDNFLPMFRNRQVNHPDEFRMSVELSRTKRNPKAYFAFIWGLRSYKKTLEVLRKMIAKAKSNLANLRSQRRREAFERSVMLNMNVEGVKHFHDMKARLLRQ